MFKYLSLFILTTALIACQNDSPEPSGQMEEMLQEQMGQPVDTDISDEELSQFVGSAVKAQEVQMESQQEMLAVVEEEGIDVQTYNLIAEADHMGQTREDLEVSSEDLEKYEKAFVRIEAIEQDMEEELTHAIEDGGMAMARFQEINMAIQQDPGLQQRVQQMLMEEQMQQQPAPGQQPQPEAPAPDAY